MLFSARMFRLNASTLVIGVGADRNDCMTTTQGGKRSAKQATAIRKLQTAEPADALATFPDNAALELRTRFRSSLRLIASTVALVTAAHDNRRGGLTATATCSLSVDPPLMLVCVNRRARTHGFMRESDRFCINYLGAQHGELARLFSVQLEDSEGKFSIGTWGVSAFGNPILLDSLATIECSVHRRIDEGTHSVFIGTVLAATKRSEFDPLVYVQGGFARLAGTE